MPLAATNKFSMSDEIIEATRVSVARAQDIDFNFIQDVIFKDGTPEYSGYNTCQCRESGISPAPMSAVVYLLVIKMNG